MKKGLKLNEWTLVVLKTANALILEHEIMYPNHFYRCTLIEESPSKTYLIWGLTFTEQEFVDNFELVHDRVLRDWKNIGLLADNGKPMSKALFTRCADIHQYGNGRKNFKIWYFRNSRDVIYGFYPMQGSKIDNQKECYQYYLDIINGDIEPLDNQDVCFGDSGIPLSYSKLRINKFVGVK